LRGQAAIAWKLQPSIGRKSGFWLGLKLEQRLEEVDDTNVNWVEYNLLDRFRRYAHAFYKRELNAWENISLAQHHHLPTRLLDWTSNPLVALYFAAEAEPSKDGAVYAFRPRFHDCPQLTMFADAQKIRKFEPDPLAVKGIKFLYSMMSTDRLVAQSGAFTIQDPVVPLEKQSGDKFDEDELDLVEVFKWRVPKECKIELLRQLNRVGINHRTLFPDLEGLGTGLLRAQLLTTKVGHF
jgi:hypothetical protein